jgi:serine/threonine protein kinase
MVQDKTSKLNYEKSFLKAIVHDATSGVYQYNGTDLSTSNEADYVLQVALVDLENDLPEKAIVKILAPKDAITSEAKALMHLQGVPGVSHLLRHKAYEVMVIRFEGDLNLHQYLLANDLSYEIRLAICDKAISMVEDCHALGVIHNDLKPTNLMIEFDANQEIKLTSIDFGSCSAINKGFVKGPIGTYNYNSPEQRANLNYDPVASEIW